MASNDYIPNSDDGFRTWAESFRDGIAASPSTYMLTAPDVTAITTVVDDFVAKLTIASNESTRTRPTIADKDDARFTCEELLRQYAIDLKYNEGISDSDKIAIGVRPVNPNREPIECPQTSPLLDILGNTPGSQTVLYADSSTPDSKAKPFGASELQLYMAVTDTPNASFTDAQFQGKYTKNPIAVEFTADQDQKVATYWARWASRRGETGPWSLPVAMTIAA